MVPAIFLVILVGGWAIYQYVSLYHKYQVLKAENVKLKSKDSV